jgi:hypothetical protein
METENQISKIEKIERRQWERLKNELKLANCPQLYVDCMSKYFNFMLEDIKEFLEKDNDGEFKI